jgi:protein-S-isoprenylcysteine O-methyltransferase Ste14
MSGTPAFDSETPAKYQRLSLGKKIQFVVVMAFWIFLVFFSAGRWDWIRGWICAIAYVVGVSVAGLLVRHFNPALIQARAQWRREDTKRFDKVLLSIFVPLSFVQPALAGLDAVRFGWSAMPFWTMYVGLILFALAMTMATWPMLVNPYAETSVRIQTDRAHRLVTAGPYRFVRHPMYVGAILMYPAMAFIFGSMWALALAAVIAALLVLRTALEDRTLRKELPGYEEFAARTQYRLMPGVW